MVEILTDPERLGYFLAIRAADRRGPRPVRRRHVQPRRTAGCWSSRGRASPTSSALDLNTGAIVWRFRVDGQRSDHMAMSPDGKHVAVSASTGNVVHILDTFTGQEVGRFPSGDSPHENNYSADGQPDLPRQHRPRLHAGRPAAVRHDEGRSPLPDRRREHQPDHQADRHGPEARGGRLPEHELRGAADGALAGRAVRLLPGLVLPRLRRVRLRPGPGHPRREPARTRSRRCRASSTCSTPRTTASR